MVSAKFLLESLYLVLHFVHAGLEAFVILEDAAYVDNCYLATSRTGVGSGSSASSILLTERDRTDDYGTDECRKTQCSSFHDQLSLLLVGRHDLAIVCCLYCYGDVDFWFEKNEPHFLVDCCRYGESPQAWTAIFLGTQDLCKDQILRHSANREILSLPRIGKA